MYSEFMMRTRTKVLVGVLAISAVLFGGSSLYLHETGQKVSGEQSAYAISRYSRNGQPKTVLGAQVKSATPSIRPTAIVSPTPSVHTPSKKLYRIAVFGDSFVDTMGEDMDQLRVALRAKYPNIQFELYNYGIGAQNVEAGLARFNSPFAYQTRSYPALPQIKADIVVIGSFSYNPFSPHDPALHRATLAKLIKTAQLTGADVYLLAEIAPLRNDFGKGPKGVNFSPQAAYEHSAHIIEQLKTAIELAKTLRVPLIDAYTPSRNPKSTDIEGLGVLVNADDGIHPSQTGHEFMGGKIADTIKLP